MAYIHELAAESKKYYDLRESTREDYDYTLSRIAALPWWNLLKRVSLSAEARKYKRRERIFYDRWMYVQKMITYGIEHGAPNPWLETTPAEQPSP